MATNFIEILTAIASILTQDWNRLYSSIADISYKFKSADLFEIMEYDEVLELLDRSGKNASIKSRVKVKFLQDRTIAFQDFVWGEGNQIAGYEISPGKVVDVYRQNGAWNILISLRDIKSRGDIVEFNIERKIIDGFTASHEWKETEIWLKFHHLKTKIIFPNTRLCKKAVLNIRGENRDKLLDNKHFHILPDGRQILSYEINRPKRAEIYSIRWDW